MATRRSFDQKLERIGELAQCDPCVEIRDEYLRTIRGRTSLLAAKAVDAAKAHGYAEVVPDLVTAFDRFMEDPAESDKGCHAKMAIVEALTEFGYREHELFLRGIRHAQLEPAWGKPVDTAERLRGRCAEALTRAGYPDIMFELVTLLCDGEPRPRSDAVRILASFGNEPAELLLRLKAMNGDAEPEILGDTLGALMEMAPERSLDFVAAFVQSRDERVAQEAALALGGSRDAGALDRLVALWDKAIGSSVKKMLLLPMALIRSDAARDSLLRIVREEPAVYAAEALDALRIYGERPEGRGIIGAAVDERGEPAVHKVFSEQYPETDE